MAWVYLPLDENLRAMSITDIEHKIKILKLSQTIFCIWIICQLQLVGNSKHNVERYFIYRSILWSLYGYFVNNWQVIAVNGLLTIVNSVVLVCLIIYRIRKVERTMLFAASDTFFFSTENCGNLHVDGCSVGYASNRVIVPNAVQTISKQRIDFVPFPPVAQIFNIELQVSIYSIMVKDYYLLVRTHLYAIMDKSKRCELFSDFEWHFYAHRRNGVCSLLRIPFGRCGQEAKT
ncbi:hypothetical protein TTRE_0000646401 [Trichuris trichiura]|uniref:Uncharacterized protein n=1 Tax=Trichuris trichiura TaxID=36087 RepID=A0A077ZEB9_TRITR|nr:hypothetical protein TTRE_0000646401 [Trichuris trichiura]